MSETPHTGRQSPVRPHSQQSHPPVDTVSASDDINAAIRAEHESIPDEIRDRVLDEAHYCQVDGCPVPDAPDAPGLIVQRISPNPPHCDRNDPQNLTVRCPHCANWIAQKPSRDDLPPVLRNRLNDVDIDNNRVEILRYLYHEGPASTGDITDEVNGLSTTVGVRRAIYDLMSLDARYDDINERLVVKDSVENEYGMPWQVSQEREERGKVPLRPTARRTRILDALTAKLLRALDGRVDNHRELVADIVDRDTTQTYHMERRAEAFDFPFNSWAEPNRTRHDDMAVVEAIDVFAGATNNLSPRRVAGPLVQLLDRNSEQELATLLCQYFDNGSSEFLPEEFSAGEGGHPTPPADQSTESPSKAAEATDDTELQVFSDSDDQQVQDDTLSNGEERK
jgi:hypothetical protein